MRLFYSRANLAPDGYQNRNPRFFSEPEPDAEHVILDGSDYPHIAEAYRAIGVAVETPEPHHAEPAPFVVETPAAPTTTLEERDRVFIPEDWRNLPWVAKADALTLRQVAALVSDTPVLNKAHAVAAIEAELVRRAGGLAPG